MPSFDILSSSPISASSNPSSSIAALDCDCNTEPRSGHENGITKRTLGILAPADLNELLDIGNLGRHGGGLCGRIVGVGLSS